MCRVSCIISDFGHGGASAIEQLKADPRACSIPLISLIPRPLVSATKIVYGYGASSCILKPETTGSMTTLIAELEQD